MFYDPLSPYGQSQQHQWANPNDNIYRRNPQVGAHTHDSQGQVMMGPLGIQQPPPGITKGQQASPFTPTNPFSSFPKDIGPRVFPSPLETPQQFNPPIKPGGSITQTAINTPPPSTGGKG